MYRPKARLHIKREPRTSEHKLVYQIISNARRLENGEPIKYRGEVYDNYQCLTVLKSLELWLDKQDELIKDIFKRRKNDMSVTAISIDLNLSTTAVYDVLVKIYAHGLALATQIGLVELPLKKIKKNSNSA